MLTFPPIININAPFVPKMKKSAGGHYLLFTKLIRKSKEMN